MQDGWDMPKAEIIAIQGALNKVAQLASTVQEGKEVIFTDSQSAIAHRNTHSKVVSDIHEVLRSLSENTRLSFHFQWVPGHTGIAGNEDADRLAGEAGNLDQSQVPISYKTAKRRIQSYIDDKWKRAQKPKIAGAVYVNPKLERGLTKRQRTLLSRIRTGGYCPEFAFYRWFITRNATSPGDPKCKRCGEEEETAEHVFDRCPALARARLQIFGEQKGMKYVYEKPGLAVEFLQWAKIL